MFRGGRKDRDAAGYVLAYLLCACAIEGCGGSGHDSPASTTSAIPPVATPPPLRPAPKHQLHGHFSGAGQLPDGTHYVEVLATVDGIIRLYIGGPLPTGIIGSGAGLPTELLSLGNAVMFAGDVSLNGVEGSGNGLVFGVACDEADNRRFCDEPAPAVIEVTATESGFISELRVETSGGDETWLLDVGEYSVYYNHDAAGPPSGLYREMLAQFAQAGEVILRVDGSGQLFFQSSDSGCTGNGTVSSHLDGKYYVWDVGLSVENCDSDYAYLNGNFDGLATVSQGGYWDYDARLLMFLAKSENSESRVALFSYSEHL